ncbi:t(6)A37 threonylcarbamoyladenosine biosynthesis protein RimN,tRNA(ANN) t(6)A37 threonylcarbamoyladenosine modification protein,Putative translation factor (SUA5),Sua5/YciO/YrdC/YwlC family protein,yrdC domain [Chlamydia serpentis]|uniref:L-threonylcarbamoyladenylate synthase n=1 Tax=Chlamydia serpentis TaxID=1967782 RepID=A0A2R8FAH5_9CHLA|nr:L-threonylcarbamoyladenylate synthase [Chlamydia serpentis]SPN73415.1 t(6)A37 threonylcarbamoyladenosine biosynthesis protein RimN,tRNA(ANN) t(6)A37 threonylcarbamoyladenosine modification protein,Putative translation factor (SUA5),Sua5/YciO/YrdC/YwlC family protein,yrdC domain [Chlamydia serpentis]
MSNRKARITRSLEEIILHIDAGKIVALPTDTVYGFVVALDSPQAEERLYALKYREPNKSFALYVNHVEDIENISGSPLSPTARKLAQHFFPGAITLVVKHCNPKFPKGMLAFRIVDHPVVQEAVNRCGILIGTSANLSSFPSACTAQEVFTDFSDYDLCIFDGPCFHGLESTVVASDPLSIYREGLISRSLIENITETKATMLSKFYHSFSKHIKIYTVKNEEHLKSFLRKLSPFNGVICKHPKPKTFYSTLREVLKNQNSSVIFIYDVKNSAYPELFPFLSPYYI